MIGTTISHFKIDKMLGSGGMGEVYRARDTRLGRDVALKLLPAAAPERLARFEREARAVAGLAHPNIVVLHAIEEHEGRHFLVLELVEGPDLTELVAPGGLPIARVLELGIPLADALASAHERGVVHRDLKPANVKLTRDGRVKVLDFGLARMLEPDADIARTIEAPLSGEGQVMGTVPYMAPEQLRGDAVDARADLFALGVILYELLTGRRPFEGRTLIDVSSAILRDTPAPLSEVRKDVPSALAHLVERCLAKDPRERVQSALDVGNELRRITAGKAVPAARPEGEVSIAVLPFANRSASPDDEYFAEGLADELLGVLARIRGLRVAARTSSGRFKGTTEDLATIGEKLKVATLLEGSVRKSGNRVRIGVQLVRVTDGDAIWSQTYDRTLEDVFAVQDEIAHAVVKELRRTLLGEADDSHASREARAEVAQVVASRRSENPEAVRLLLQARHVIGRRTQADLVTAIRILEQAIALEPSFARAWTELSRTHFSFVSLELGDRELHLARAREALDRALALEPELADAHAHRAYMAMVGDVDLAGAAMALEPALRLEPNNPAVLGIAGILAAIHGRFKEAIAVQQRIVEMDPLQPVAYRNLALMWSASGQHDVALDVIQKAIELAPESIGIRSMHSRILARLGRIDEALSEADRERDDSVRTYARALALSLGGRRVEAEQELALLIRDHGGDSAAQIASVYGALGETDSAFSWLDRGWDARDPGVLEIQYNRELDSLHADPRWAELLRRVGLQS